MTISEKLSAGFGKIVSLSGKPVRIRYFLGVPGSVWDDDVTLTEVTGSEVWTSGVVMPLSISSAGQYRSSEDVLLLEQGKLENKDMKIYVNGSLDFTGTGSNFKIKIGMNGSPTQLENYTIVPAGGIPVEVEGTQIYKKVYIRLLTNGSLIGEAA